MALNVDDSVPSATAAAMNRSPSPPLHHFHRSLTRSSYHHKSHHSSSPSPQSPPLPFHLQDQHHPRIRKRSSLSTHSYDMNSPILGLSSSFETATPRRLSVYQFTSQTSPTSRVSSSSQSPWYLSPNSPRYFDRWPMSGNGHGSLTHSHSVDVLHSSPTLSRFGNQRARKSLDFGNDRKRSFFTRDPLAAGNWYSDSDSHSSISSLSAISSRAVVHPHTCRSYPAFAFDYITPVPVKYNQLPRYLWFPKSKFSLKGLHVLVLFVKRA